MREQTFQRLLKPHSCGASWRDKKLPAGGTQPKVPTGLPSEPLRPFLILYMNSLTLAIAAAHNFPGFWKYCLQEKAVLGWKNFS